MKLTREDVQRIAILARLRLTPQEEASLTGDLEAILGYMKKLNQVNTDDVEPFSHTSDHVNVFRDDQVTNRPNSDELLANAPERDETFFKVPKIIE